MVAGVFSSQSWYQTMSYQHDQKDGRSRRRGMVVHVGSMPLRAPPGPAQWALSSVDRLLAIQHFYTILQPIPAPPSDQSPCTVFDFQPQNPEDLYTVFVGLSGGTIPGVILERTITHLPVRRCWRIGMTKDGITMKDAVEFNREWDTRLQLWKHDCRHHTDALVEFLTGESEILRKLKNTASSKAVLLMALVEFLTGRKEILWKLKNIVSS